MTGKKSKIWAFLLVFAEVITCMPVNAYANTYEDSYEDSFEDFYEDNGVADIDIADSDGLLEGYLDQLVESRSDREIIIQDKAARRELLNEINQYIYDFLADRITMAACGDINSSVFETGNIDMAAFSVKTEFSEEEIGVTDLGDNEAGAKALELAGVDISKVFQALLEDFPYELYWYDTFMGNQYTFTLDSTVENGKLHISSVSYTISMPVSSDYSITGETGTTDIDTVKTGAASSAVDTAKTVVTQAIADGCDTDFKKLKYYKDYICKKVKYDENAAAGMADYGDPWQVINVFDPISDTDVICEGYSKAFKMLCDLTNFDYNDFDCYLMTGKLSINGSSEVDHMWNVVHMDDGKNYLVDITYCDNELTPDNRFFMAGFTAVVDHGYSICIPEIGADWNDPSYTCTYIYDQSILSGFSEAERSISTSHYPCMYKKIAVTLDSNGGEIDTSSIEVEFCSVYGALPYPYKDDAYFGGWYTEKTEGTRVEDNTEVTNEDAHTLYAHWLTEPYEPEKKEYRTIDFTVDGIGYRFLKGGTVALTNGDAASGEYEIPSSVNYNGKTYAVSKIEGGAFYKNDKITGLTIPGSVIELEDNIPTGNYYENGVDKFGDAIWSNEYAPSIGYCQNLKEIVFNEGLESIGEEAISDCPQISSLVFPESLKVLRQNALCDNAGLKSVYFGENVFEIWIGVLSRCTSLSMITVSDRNETYISRDGVLYDEDYCIAIYPEGKKDETYVINDGAKVLLTDTFYGNSYLKKLIVPKSITSLGSYATRSSSIEEIEIDPDNPVYKSIDGVVYSKDGSVLWYYPAGRRDRIFFIPSTVKKIAEKNGYAYKTFDDNPYLEELYVPASVEEINSSWACLTGLKKLVFAKNCRIEQLRAMYFQQYQSLESLCFPSGLEKLQNLEVEDEYIYGDAYSQFLRCDSLQHIYFAKGSDFYTKGEGLQRGKYLFAGITCTIYGHGTGNKVSEFAEAAEQKYVDVDRESVPILGVTFDDTNIVLQPEEKCNVNATAYPLTSEEKVLAYESSNTDIAIVDNDGGVTAVSEGECYITARACDEGNEYARCHILVKPKKTDAIVSITDEDPITKAYGDADFELHATVDEPGEGEGVWKWMSENESIAEVEESTGKITVKGIGTTNIKVAYESETTIGEASIALSVTKKPVTITGVTVADKEYDRTTDAVIKTAGTVNGVVEGDEVSVVAGTARFEDKNVGNKAVSFSGFTISGQNALNYSLSSQPADVTASINTKAVTVNVSAVNRDYVRGDKTVELTVGDLSGVIDGDNVSLDISSMTGNMEDANAGIGKPVTVAGLKLTGDDAGNYSFIQPVGVVVDVNKAPITAPGEITRKYLFREEANDSIDMSSFLPEDAGTVAYTISETPGDVSYKENPSINGNILSYTLNAATGRKNGSIAVTARMQNYNDVTITVNIRQTAMALYEKTGKNKYEVRGAKTLNQGNSFTLIPIFADGTAVNKRVVWSSSNPDVATVTQDGKVTARTAGKTTITAMSEEGDDLTASCLVSVRESATVVSLNRKSYTFGTGESVLLNVTLLPFTASQELEWSTSDSSVAVVCDGTGAELNGTVSGTGKIYDVSNIHEVTIKATGTGKASLTALAADGSGKKAVCKLTVGMPVHEFSVAGKGGKTSLVAGKTLAMTINWGSKSSKPANTGITWSVERAGGGDASAIASISSKGVLTGITAGTVTVTASSTANPEIKKSIDITVNAPKTSKAPKVTGISLSNKASLSDNGLYTGKSYTLKTRLTLSAKGKAASDAVAWISSNPAVATVSQKGVIKAVTPGSVTVRAVPRDTDNDLTALGDSVTFNVYAKVTSIKIDKTKLTLGTQSDTQYGKISVVTISPADATNSSIKWTSNSKSVSMAAIDKDGYPSDGEFKSADPVIINSGQALAVRGLKPGVVKLTGITMDGSKKKVKCTVTIRGEVTGLAFKTSTGKKGVNDVTLSDDSVPGKARYTGNMKANSTMTLKPVVDINGISGSATDKATQKTYTAYKKNTDTSVSYRSSDTSVATVDKKGKISIKKEVAAGSTVTIFATSADGRYESSILITIVK